MSNSGIWLGASGDRAAIKAMLLNMGTDVVLRIPSTNSSDTPTEVGAKVVELHDCYVGKGMLSAENSVIGKYSLILSADDVQKLVSDFSYANANALFAAATSIVIDGTRYCVSSPVILGGKGGVIGYRVELEIMLEDAL